MNMPVHPAVIWATISAQGVLLAADLPLLALQRQAGGELDAPLAVPQLAAVARLASRLGIAISRPVVAASDQGDIGMWVRAKPEGEAVQLSVIEWNERPLPVAAMEKETVVPAATERLTGCVVIAGRVAVVPPTPAP